jgi:protein involved in polysaccharide export with SLBB domain
MPRNALTAFALLVALSFAGCATVARAQPFPPLPVPVSANGPPAAFSEASAPYRFYPGDQVEVTVLSAPELSRTVTIAPDGRIDLPLIDPVLAADLTADELRNTLLAAYAQDLRMPELEVTATGYGSNQVYVAGEVQRAGVYEFRGPIDPLQAIALAGGFLNSARRQEIVIISRAPGGPREVTIVDLRNPEIRAGLARAPTLRRFDVVYVPRSRISNWNLWVQQYVRDALPINFSLFYDLAQER